MTMAILQQLRCFATRKYSCRLKHLRTWRKFLLTTGLALACGGTALAQTIEPIKIGVLTDMSSGYSDLAGTGSIEMVRLAVEELGSKVLGAPVQVLFADPQNKPEVGVAIANKWFDEGVDAIFDVPNSSIAFAIAELAKQRNKLFFATSAGSSELHGARCSSNTMHWGYNTYSVAKSIGTALVKQNAETWYFLTADYAFGQALERDTRSVVTAAGAKILGSVKHPLNTTDFSSFLIQAQGSGASVIGLANAGADLRNAISQANEFGIVNSKTRLAGLIVFILDVHALGLEKAKGLRLADNFYWDMDDKTRALSKRYFDRMKRMPTMNQAANYSAALNYLKAIEAIGSKDPVKVMAQLRKGPINDAVVRNGTLREDGLLKRDYYVYSVKSPSESKAPWDYYKYEATVPADVAARPLSEGNCPLVKAKN